MNIAFHMSIWWLPVICAVVGIVLGFILDAFDDSGGWGSGCLGVLVAGVGILLAVGLSIGILFARWFG